MKTKDLKIGDKIRVKNSISGTVIEITDNGWVKVVWNFINDGKLLNRIDFPSSTEISGFRAKNMELIQ